MNFKQKGILVCKNEISNDLINLLKFEFEEYRKIKYLLSENKNLYAFEDNQCPKTFSAFETSFFNSLSKVLNKRINEIVGKDLSPTFSYARIYYKGSELIPHIDRESCEYSTTICIDSTQPWSIYFEDLGGDINEINLNPGDMCVYMGSKLKHWRHIYTGEKHMQCFLSYVDINGKYSNYKNDERNDVLHSNFQIQYL